MKRVSIMLMITVILSLCVCSMVSAATPTHKVSLKLEKITYSKQDHTYYAYTEADADGGHWVVDIDSKGMTLKQLKKKYLNHMIDIYYVGNVSEDEEIEIVKSIIR